MEAFSLFKPGTWRKRGNGVDHSGNGAGGNGHSLDRQHDDGSAETPKADAPRHIKTSDPRFRDLEEDYLRLLRCEGTNTFLKEKGMPIQRGAEFRPHEAQMLMVKIANQVFLKNRQDYAKNGGAEAVQKTMEYLQGFPRFCASLKVPGVMYHGEPLYVEFKSERRFQRKRVHSFNPWMCNGQTITVGEFNSSHENGDVKISHRSETVQWEKVKKDLRNEHDKGNALSQFLHRIPYRVDPIVQGLTETGIGAVAGATVAHVAADVLPHVSTTAKVATVVGAAIPAVRTAVQAAKHSRSLEPRWEREQRKVTAGSWGKADVTRPESVSVAERRMTKSAGLHRKLITQGVTVAALMVSVSVGERIMSLASDIGGKIMAALSGRSRAIAARTLSSQEQQSDREAALPEGVRVSFDAPPLPRPDVFGDLRQRLLPHMQPPEPLMSVTVPESASPVPVAITPVAPLAAAAPAQVVAPTQENKDTPAPLQALSSGPDSDSYDGKDHKAQVEGLSEKGNDLVNLFYRLKTQPEHQARRARVLSKFFAAGEDGITQQEEIARSLGKPLSEGGLATLSAGVKKEQPKDAKPGETIFATHVLVDQLGDLPARYFNVDALLDNSLLFPNLVTKLRQKPGFADMIPEWVRSRTQLRELFAGTPHILKYLETEIALCGAPRGTVAKAVRALHGS